MNYFKHSQLVILGALTLLACNEEPLGSTPSTAYRIDATCTAEEPWCNEDFAPCMERGAQACNTCYAIGGLGCSSYCDYTDACRSRHCGRNEGQCRVWSYTATLGEVDPSILETCQLAAARNASCGDTTYPAGACELFAATERSEAAGLYQCYADTPCGVEEACEEPAPDEELTSIVCESMARCELDFEDCDNGGFAEWFGWFRHDVKNALRECTDIPTCDERVSCFRAWLESVNPY